jgi:hypothetical protein
MLWIAGDGALAEHMETQACRDLLGTAEFLGVNHVQRP